MSDTISRRVKSLLRANQVRLRLPTCEQVPPGVYHFTREVDGFQSRFHVRVDTDGHGMLIANASLACRLSPAGVFMTLSLLKKEPKRWTFTQMAQRFRGVSHSKVARDYEALQQIIDSLAAPGDNYLITNLDDPWATPHARQLSAPLRADMPVGRDAEDAGIQILHRLWEAAIPQVCLLASRDTPPSSLIRLIERAEDIGMVAGVRILSEQLMQDGLLNALAQAGVDFLTILYAWPAEVHKYLFGEKDYTQVESTWDAIHSAEVCPVAQIPLLNSTAFRLGAAVEELVAHKVTTISFFAITTPPGEQEDNYSLGADGLPQVATLVEESSHEFGIRFLWEPPVARDPQRSISEQCLAGPRCAGDIAVRVEPDGSVVPPRGPYRIAGNILKQPWTEIWENEAFRRYRERVESPTRCDTCPGLAICAADCPKDPRGWATT